MLSKAYENINMIEKAIKVYQRYYQNEISDLPEELRSHYCHLLRLFGSQEYDAGRFMILAFYFAI
jgi:hypothetical protein